MYCRIVPDVLFSAASFCSSSAFSASPYMVSAPIASSGSSNIEGRPGKSHSKSLARCSKPKGAVGDPFFDPKSSYERYPRVRLSIAGNTQPGQTYEIRIFHQRAGEIEQWLIQAIVALR